MRNNYQFGATLAVSGSSSVVLATKEPVRPSRVSGTLGRE
jgi:hypothetical protein